MKEISNIFYCRACNSINKIQSNFTKSKKLICNNCENVFNYELLFCKQCDKTTYFIKLESNTNTNTNTNTNIELDSKYICICNLIYNIDKTPIYNKNCCFIL